MYYMLFYDYVDNYLERRDAYRDAHLAGANQALQSGELKMAGAFSDRPYRAALIFDVDDVSVIERFVADDPYVQNGLVTEWTIRPWNVVIGG